MKKLFFASIVMLETLTACNNSEAQINPEEQKNQTFSGNISAREGDEKEDSSQAEIILQKDLEAGGGTDTQRILCHTPYNYASGHACVVVNNHLFNVSWETVWYPPTPNIPGDEIGEVTEYTATLTGSCNCR